MIQQVSASVRSLTRASGFTGSVIASLAIGFAATFVTVAIVDGVLVRSLPYERSHELYLIWEENKALARTLKQKLGSTPFDTGRFPVSGQAVLDWKQHIPALRNAAAYDTGMRLWVLAGEGDSEEVRVAITSHELLPLLGVRPVLGRAFSPAEDRAGATRVTLITHRLWVRRFGTRTTILGHSVLLNGKDYEVVGVLPRDFSFLNADVYVPLALGTVPQDFQRGSRRLAVLSRLPGESAPEPTRSQLAAYAARIAQEQPGTNWGWSVAVVPLKEQVAGPMRPQLLAFAGAALLMLLICGSNAGILILTRTIHRQRDLATRVALGASPLAAIQHMLVEILLLWACAALLGLLLAYWGLEAARTMLAAHLPRHNEIELGGRALAIAAALIPATAALFGLAPALLAARRLPSVIRSAGISCVLAPRRRFGPYGMLVMSEIALAMALAIAAGLLAKTLHGLWAVDAGFLADGVTTMRVTLPSYRFPQDRRREFITAVLERIRHVPGVESASAANPLPFSSEQQSTGLSVPGNQQDGLSANYRVVSPDYFRVMRMPIRQGRAFTAGDAPSSSPVIIISDSMAARFWPGLNPLGRVVRLFIDETPRTVVGVVGDVRDAGLEQGVGPSAYVPYSQAAAGAKVYFAIRFSTPVPGVAAALRREVNAVARDVPVEEVVTMRERIAGSLTVRRFLLVVFGSFASVAVLLALIGIYGVVAYAVAQSTREIAVRMALGAMKAEIAISFLWRAMQLTLIGLAAGIGLALGLGRLLAAQLYGVRPTDPATFAQAALLFTAVTLLALAGAVFKATSVNVIAALRQD